jgi:hypothetical protein
MARYYPVSPLFWMDDKIARLDDQGKVLALYLLTCEHRNLEGLYRLPYAYIQADLAWTDHCVRGGMTRLIDDGFIDYDPAARVVFLPKALKYHEPKAPKQVQGAVNALQQVPDTTLWPDFLEAAATFAPALYAAIGTPLPTPSVRDTQPHA